MVVLLSDFVWEGTTDERLTDPFVQENKRDGHVFKELDTGESYLHRGGDWEFINLGLSFIKATKSGRIVTDSGGGYSVVFNTPFIDDSYTVSLSCEEVGSNFNSAFFDNITVGGFDIITRRRQGQLQGGVVVSWLATRDYNP